MNKTQGKCLVSISEVARKLKEECAQPEQRFYTPKYGINNKYGWREFLPAARSVSRKEIKDELDGCCSGSAYSVKVELFQTDLVSHGDGYDIFRDLCLNNYWLWSLVEEVSRVALDKKCFPITPVCFVEAIERLKGRVPKVRFDALETTLERSLSERTGLRDLVERSSYLKRRVEEPETPSLAKWLRDNITDDGFQQYLEHGLILVHDEYESDPRKAKIRFNKLLLLDWQLGQRGPVFVRNGGLEVIK